ncbi:MAG: hypothetical protein M3328_05895, partial [Chloroflexota bacterium]|nr:hypothetical protein [Chloroflexota bacterium]
FKFPKKPGDLEAAIKEIGKYGERFSGVAKESLGVGVPGGSNFDEMANTFKKLLLEAKGQADKTLQERLAREAEKVMGEVSGALNQLEATSNTVIKELQQQAELEAVEGGVVNMQKVIANHGMLMRAKDATLQQLRVAIEAIKDGTIAAQDGDAAAPAAENPPQ